jgi:hypothetical protein
MNGALGKIVELSAWNWLMSWNFLYWYRSQDQSEKGQTNTQFSPFPLVIAF